MPLWRGAINCAPTRFGSTIPWKYQHIQRHRALLHRDRVMGRNALRPYQRCQPGLVKTIDVLLKMVPEIGIEPTTYALRMRRSTN